MSNGVIRPLAGAGMVLFVVGLVALTAAMFTGATTSSDTVRVVAPRAGLVLEPGAKVQMRGVTVGRVARIEYDQPGSATIELAIEPDQMKMIPQNVRVNIAAPTVFGAKSVEFVSPPSPSADPLQDGQELGTEDVSIEVNTVFEELTQVLSQIRPAELNAALSAISTGLSGRGDQFGQMLTDLNGYLGTVNGGLPAMRALLRTTPEVMKVYADTSAPLLRTVEHATRISDTVVTDEQKLDAFLTSVIGLSNTGNRILTDNRTKLARTASVLVPTLALTDEYRQALTCTLNGFAWLSNSSPADVPGLGLSANFLFGVDPYRYPKNLPKVAAKGGPQCSVLNVGFQEKPPFVVTDVGANPFEEDRRTVKLNVDSLRQMLFGPIPDGAPR
ncbi:MCE family protein [Gordonia sp. ABSL1-1]|uniref:MCE family protein n=1 Tax=Gordonia sp. ABSL1-1 TaxID=3053923 RepID=UPI0025743F9C|nr:MCE family protein [Gordonia sp. ABSL1-1]MDL9936220.1 MCE family protein [Gordonia sp. ABSL1-1]